MWLANTPELKAFASGADLFPLLNCQDSEKLKVPLLLLVGDRSPTYLIEISKELDRLLANSRSVTLENSSHGLYFEQPEAANRAVMQFLAEH